MNIDIETANEYFSKKYGCENWNELSDENKNSAINTAQNKIAKLPFIGTKIAPEQSSIFPREYDGTVINMPDDVVKAIFEEAYNIIKNYDITQTNIPDGVQSLSLGGAAITFKENSGNNLLSSDAKAFLDGWIKTGFSIASEKFKEVY